MKFTALLVVLTGLVLAPVWGATPASACENCSCQGDGTGQMSQVIQALTGSGGSSEALRPAVTSDGPLRTVSQLAQAVTRRLGASGVFGISTPISWR